MKVVIKFIPNFLTSTRVIMSFLFVYNIIEQFVFGKERSINLIILFLGICISDFFDGRIARKTNSISVIGAKFDVFADLLYIIISYVALIYIKILPLWFLIFICLKFLEFAITSRFMKKNNKSSDNPFIFDKVGRVVAAMFFIIPGIVCVYKCIELYKLHLILTCLLYVIFLAGIYSSYLRIKSCLMFYKL